MDKLKRNIVIVICLICADVFAMFMFAHFSELFFPWYRSFSKTLMALLASVSSFAPFSVWDILLAAFIIYEFYLLIKDKNLLTWLGGLLLTVVLVFSFVLFGWMLNHYAPPLSDYLQLDVKPTDIQKLKEATVYYLEKADEASRNVKRDETGDLVRNDDALKKAGSIYKNMPEAVFHGSEVTAKHFSLIGDYLLYNGITGMFMPLTGEASIPSHVPNVDQAFCLSHEVAHRLGIASEQEANFSAYLACINSKDSYFIYSGQYNAFWYCYNALYRADPVLAEELIENERGSKDTLYYVLRDGSKANAIYDSYDSPLVEVSDKINDTYLKSFSHDSGIQSYGEVVDYLIAYYDQIKIR